MDGFIIGGERQKYCDRDRMAGNTYGSARRSRVTHIWRSFPKENISRKKGS